jgi:hypothetical protein
MPGAGLPAGDLVIPLAAALTVLRFTTPTQDAYDGLGGAYCETSPAPVGVLAEARLYRLGVPQPEQVHVAGLPGARDSFAVDVSDGGQRTYYVTLSKPSGVESCRSNYVTLNGQLDVPLPVERVRFYDLQGRECHDPLPVGIYWRKQGLEVRKVVVIR